MAKKKVGAVSPVRELLDHVWAQGQAGMRSGSWERLNNAMRQALNLAIGAGFKFEPTDLPVPGEFRPGYWLGDPEWIYSMAIREGNYTAVAVYEAWKQREPIIAANVFPDGHADFAHKSGMRTAERLHVGAEFTWKGEQVTVTSFRADGAAIACSYKNGLNGTSQRRIKKRYTITREMVIEERRKGLAGQKGSAA